ncbi:MAG: Pr6Pr family membrane protein [Methylocella sp.]
MGASRRSALRSWETPVITLSSTLHRIYAGALAVIAWLGLGAQVAQSTEDALSEHASIATQLVDQFSRFSIQTTTLVALVATIAFIRPRTKSLLLRPSVQAALVVYVAVVGVVFEVLLRSDAPGLQLVDRVFHGVIPILYLVYWLIFAPKGNLSMLDPALWLIYPLLFFAYTMVRGEIFGVYLRRIQEIIKHGYGEFFTDALAFFAAFLAIGFILVAIDQAFGEWQSRRRSEQGQVPES